MSEKKKITGKRKLLPKGDPLRNKIVIARRTMLEKFPFFGNIAMWLEPNETDEVPTLAVTHDRKLLINREFCEKASEKDMILYISHEAMHLVLESTSRFPTGGISELWNFATDYAINYLLINKDKGAGMDPPSGCKLLYDPGKYGGKSAEAIYYDLIQEAKKHPCSCSGKGKSKKGEGNSTGKGCDHWHDDSGTRCAGATEDEKEVWKRIIQTSAEAARQAGNLPGALDEFVTELYQPRKNWRRELQYYVSTYCKQRYDWKVRNRRTISQNIITPGKSPYLPQGIVGIDTSGSMSDEDIRKCIIEHAGILSVAGGEGTLGLFDAVLYYYGDVDLNSLKRLPVQRGGTDFRPLFQKIEDEGKKPAYLVLFTDLWGPFPEKAPEYPVIICRTQGSDAEPPWPSCKMIDLEL